MNNYVKNSINIGSGELTLLMCEALHFLTHFAGLCSFLEANPRLVILCHLLQPVIQLLLRLTVIAFVVPPLLQNCLQHC